MIPFFNRMKRVPKEAKSPKIKVSHRQQTSSKRRAATPAGNASTGSELDQSEIDKILDKISESGYDSLSKDEKEKLFNASKK